MKRYIRTSSNYVNAEASKLRRYVGKDYLVLISVANGHLYQLYWTLEEMLRGKRDNGHGGFFCGTIPFYAKLISMDEDKVILEYVIDEVAFTHCRYDNGTINMMFTPSWSSTWRFQLPLSQVRLPDSFEVIPQQEFIDMLRDRIK